MNWRLTRSENGEPEIQDRDKFPLWSPPTEKALAELQESAQQRYEAHEAAVRRLVDQPAKDPVARPQREGRWVDTGSGPGYVVYPDRAREFLAEQRSRMESMAADLGPGVHKVAPGVWFIQKGPGDGSLSGP